MPLDVLVPGLILPPDSPAEMRALRLPALERWLGAAAIERRPGGAAARLAERFGLASPVPVAPIALAAEAPGVRAGAWLRADPVHVAIGQASAAIESGSRLGIAAEEANDLAAALSQHFHEDGLAFVAAAPDRWYVSVPAGELPEIAGGDDPRDPRSLSALPTSRGRINWRGTLTEAQMLLAAHAVNAARESRGQPAINSVRLWGPGDWPVRIDAPYAVVYAGDIFVRGLARASGARALDVPKALGDIEGAGAILLHLDALDEPADRRDADSWREAALEIDRKWFEPLRAMLDRLAPVRIMLAGPASSRVATLKRPSLLAKLLPAKPLSAYA